MKQPIYLDHSATTAISQNALTEMVRCYQEDFGNPSAIYPYGQTAKTTLEHARNSVARSLGALNSEIYFTSGGTESDNWVLEGVARQNKSGHIITSAMEHNAILQPLERLEQNGFSVTRLLPDHQGKIAAEQLEQAIRPDTCLISIMTANNVVGTLQDIRALAKIAHSHHVLFHTDAVQAVGHIKLHGPKGAGALYCKLPRRLPPLILGGGQEKGERSGTENVPGISAMALALQECVADLERSVPALTELRDYLIQGMTKIPGVHLTGDPTHRLPGLASFVVEGIPHSGFLVSALGERGIYVSSGSACSASSQEASHVLQYMGYSESQSKCALRFSLDMENTREEMDRVLSCLPPLIEKLRRENHPF